MSPWEYSFGRIDSTTIASLAAEAGCDLLQTVTLGFGQYTGKTNDEVPLAERVAVQLSTHHRTIFLDREDIRNDFDRFPRRHGQPSIDGLNSYFVSKAAARAGLKVVLSGLGGDELFCGYPSFTRYRNRSTLSARLSACR